MKIGQLARTAGLNASAIRYYEKCGLLAAPQRLSGQRRYSSDALSRVLLIRFATDMGFTLTEIKLFLSGLRDNTPVGPRWKKLATRKLIEVEQNIAGSLKLKSLLRNLLRCHCVSLQQCVRALGLSENLRSLSQLQGTSRSGLTPALKQPKALLSCSIHKHE
jgi:MerR family transcriptional regulator, redox-sensitive transcriptional activator SoxR